MSKPWDKLKQAKGIAPGTWETAGCMSVEVVRVAEEFADISFEPGCMPWIAGPTDLRELAEFCVELADQLEGK